MIFDGREQVLLESNGSEVSTTNPLPIVNLGAIITDNYDYVGVTYPSGDTEVYTFKSGGSGGTTIATVTIVYTDSTKTDLLSVTKV